MDELTWYLFRKEHYKKNLTHPLLTSAAVLGMFFRQNGFYVVAVLILFVAGRELYLIIRKKQTFACAVLILAVLIIPLGIGKINTSCLHKKYNATSVSTRAMLSMPLQQTARYMIYHSDDLSAEEKKIIQKVIDYTPEEFAENYNPYKFDGIKHGFSKKASKEDLLLICRFGSNCFYAIQRPILMLTLNQNLYFVQSPGQQFQILWNRNAEDFSDHISGLQHCISNHQKP